VIEERDERPRNRTIEEIQRSLRRASRDDIDSVQDGVARLLIAGFERRGQGAEPEAGTRSAARHRRRDLEARGPPRELVRRISNLERTNFRPRRRLIGCREPAAVEGGSDLY